MIQKLLQTLGWFLKIVQDIQKLCWLLNVGDNFKILLTKMMLVTFYGNMTSREHPKLVTNTFGHQHPSPTSITNINEAGNGVWSDLNSD